MPTQATDCKNAQCSPMDPARASAMRNLDSRAITDGDITGFGFEFKPNSSRATGRGRGGELLIFYAPPRKHTACSVRFQPAVSPISNRQRYVCSGGRMYFKHLQAGNPAIQQVRKPALLP